MCLECREMHPFKYFREDPVATIPVTSHKYLAGCGPALLAWSRAGGSGSVRSFSVYMYIFNC